MLSSLAASALTAAAATAAAGPDGIWSAWRLDPLVIGLLLGAWALHRRGRVVASGPARWRSRAFGAGLVVIGVALLSPLEAAAGELASAHMVQHVLLMLVAAPLLAFSAPGSALLRGAPSGVRRLPAVTRRRGLRWEWLSHPVVALVAYVAALWLWHASAAYDAAVGSDIVHALEHATFLGAALLFWRVLASGRTGRRVPGGVAALFVFGGSMASVMLALLLTFATEPFYASYAATAPAWGLTPLEDQHLAGVLMWVPAGAIHVAIALALFALWVREGDRDPYPGPVTDAAP